MLNSLDKDSSLYQYLVSECGWLLEPLKGSFTIKVLNLSKAKFIVSNRNYRLHSNQADNHPRKFAGIS